MTTREALREARSGPDGACSEAISRIDAALSAPGEQRPVAWQFWTGECWILCEPPDTRELRDDPEKFRPLYISAPPAPGWDELEPVLSFMDELAANAASGKREALNPILIGGSAKLYAEGLREALRREAPASSGENPLLTITYTNYKGETSERRIAPKSLRFGSTEWHPEPQWLLLAYDADKQADREFALKDFGSRPDAGGGVRVKPLEWIDREGVETFDASTPVGHYIATITASGRGAWFIVGLTQSNYTVSDISNVKAAAQADYEQRILSALSTPPAAEPGEPIGYAVYINGEVRLPYFRKKRHYVERLIQDHALQGATVVSLYTSQPSAPDAPQADQNAEQMREQLREKCELLDDISPGDDIGAFDASGRWISLWTVDDFRALTAAAGDMAGVAPGPSDRPADVTGELKPFSWKHVSAYEACNGTIWGTADEAMAESHRARDAYGMWRR